MKRVMFMGLFLVLALTSVVWAEEGSMKTYFPNGKVQMEMSDAGVKTYYESGQLMSQVDYKDGEPSGVGKTFYEDGKVMREDDYANKHWKQYAPEGNLAAEGSM